MTDERKGGAYQTEHLEGVDVQNAEEGVPDRDDTGGGPRGGNTVDGRTGPGETGAQGGPESTLRDAKDYSGDGNLGSNASEQGDELGTLGGWGRDVSNNQDGES